MIIWVASYPRSGNTLARIILNKVFNIKTYSIYNDVFDIGNNSNLSELVGHKMLPDDFNIDDARNSEEVYFIKTHEYPPNETDKAIYILRDGRESTISFWKYMNTYHDKNCRLIDIIYGNNFVGSWGDHVAAWNPEKRENTLYLKFEELVDNPASFAKPMADFIGADQGNGGIPDFNVLKKNHPDFFRSGKKSSWKNIMTDNEQNIFWIKNYRYMLDYGYTDDIPDIFNANNELVTMMNLLSQEYSYLQRNIIGDNRVRIQQLNKQIKTMRENYEHNNANLRNELNCIKQNKIFRLINYIFKITS